MNLCMNKFSFASKNVCYSQHHLLTNLFLYIVHLYQILNSYMFIALFYFLFSSNNPFTQTLIPCNCYSF